MPPGSGSILLEAAIFEVYAIFQLRIAGDFFTLQECIYLGFQLNLAVGQVLKLSGLGWA